MSNTLVRGENKLITVQMLQADGTPLLYSALSALKVELMQNGQAQQTYTQGMPNAPLRAAPSTTAFLLEITETISAALQIGALFLRVTMTVPDTDFSTSGNEQTSITSIAGPVVVDA